MSELREYQKRAITELRTAIQQDGSAVLVCPTGSGKTKIAGEIARLATQKGNRVMFLVHRRELVRQVYRTLESDCSGLSIGIEAAGFPSSPWSLLQIGMVQSIVRRKHFAAFEPSLVIVDECHHARASSWEKVLERWPNAKRLGLSATPQRLDGRGLVTHFSSLVLGPSIQTLVNQGFLAPMRTLTLPSQFRRDSIRKDRHGELRQADVQEQVTEGVIADGVDSYLRYATGRRAVFFAVHVEHSKRIAEGLCAKGVRAAHLDATDTTGRRDRIVSEWATGGLEVLTNVQLFDEGVDIPECDVVIDGSPTQSVTRYLQRAGRAMRPKADGGTALHLDTCGNSYELGLPQENREWSLEDGEVDGVESKTKAKPRSCRICQTAFYGRQCPHCEHIEPMAEVQEVDTELVEAQAGKPKARKRRSDLWRDLAIAKKSRDPRRSVEAIAQRRGYKPGWAMHILRAWNM